MERKSSMKDSGLGSLFRATDPNRHDDSWAGAGVPVDTSAGASEAGTAGGTGATDQGRRHLIQPSRTFPAVIRVFGVGGAGTNAVNRMLEAGVEGVEFIAVNTDVQALQMCEADHKLRIGREITKGLGGGSDPQVGRDAAVAAYDEIKSLLKGSDMVFITAGEGGGTGTGASPIIAEIAKEVGALTIGVVSRPFGFEGRRRQEQATKGINSLREKADTVIVVPNDKLLTVVERGTSMLAALRVADDVLRQGIQGICDLVTMPGLINLDLADVRTIMTGAGTAHMGIGTAHGEQRASRAAEAAINSQLLETSIQGARGILLNVSGGTDLSLFEVNEVAQAVNKAADSEANIIFGAVIDPSLGDSIRVTVVAAGFSGTVRPRVERPVRVEEAAEDAKAAEAPAVEAAPTSAPAAGPGDGLEIPSFVRSNR
jgi:cell division protein FtsZ